MAHARNLISDGAFCVFARLIILEFRGRAKHDDYSRNTTRHYQTIHKNYLYSTIYSSELNSLLASSLMLVKVTRLNVVESLLLAIELVERCPEEDTADEGENTHDTVVPYEQPT